MNLTKSYVSINEINNKKLKTFDKSNTFIDKISHNNETPMSKNK